MTYPETLEFLYSSLPAYQRIGKAAYKSDLETTLSLDKHLGKPHLDFNTIHVAGTNGKGSVSHLLASVFSEAGYKTGLYTSPHIRDFRERIKINGKEIGEDYIVDFVGKIRELIDDLKPSFFEMTVAMAFQYFSDMNVDLAIIETGMGGRLDSTNIITPLVSVITNIGLDHTQFLGTTKPEIAREKAGIIKNNIPLVIGRSDPETEFVFREEAERNGSVITFSDTQFSVLNIADSDPGIMPVRIKHKNKIYFERLDSGLTGHYQTENIATVLSTLEILKHSFNIDKKDIEEGLKNVVKNTGFEGRWQVVGKSPLVICDTAHNQDGLEKVLSQLENLDIKQKRFVLGFVDDKDLDQILGMFPPDSKYYLTRATVPRSLGVDILASKAGRLGLDYRKFENVSLAFVAALKESQAEDLIYIGGSTFIVADYLELSK